MSVDPRSLIYPGLEERDTTGTNEELQELRDQASGNPREGERRRDTVSDDPKELDRVERRRQ